MKKIDLKEVGLNVGSTLYKYFLKTEHMHYGIWTSDLNLSPENLKLAQENYTNFLLKHIPKEVRSILDVGCGTGKNAEKLLEIGYKVDCVSPSPHLTQRAKKILGDRVKFYQSTFEEIEFARNYDLILFSESFQYIKLDQVFDSIENCLNPNGHLIICDFFRKDVEGTSSIGGGHDINKFYNKLKEYPIRILSDQDITNETAPTIDLLAEILSQVFAPIWETFAYYFKINYPILSKFIMWKYKKRFNKIRMKYLTNRSTAEQFMKFKTYHFIVLQKSI